MAEFTEEEIQETIKKLTSVIKGKPVDNSYNFSGFKDQILWPEFKEMKDKVGLFGFINGESCAACTQYLKNLKNLGTLKSKIVQGRDESTSQPPWSGIRFRTSANSASKPRRKPPTIRGRDGCDPTPYV